MRNQIMQNYHGYFLTGLIPDDTNPKKWTNESCPKHE
ncbi:hypothetical protein CLOL250_01623 [Clostridium sp. L2-50]|nr:hypothetical protein CLOL250_01623 [Clostridium sp. L2-50]